MKLKCKGCLAEYEIEEESVKKDKYIQCAFCGRVSDNPLYEEEK